MKKTYLVIALAVALAVLIAAPGVCMAQAAEEVENVQKYGRALDVMGMLLIGFGFLMVFVRKYGRSALTATFLVVSVAIPLYLAIDAGGILGGKGSVEVDRLILAEFAAASLLICSGAVLGRLKMHQYILLALLFIPLYMLNEWLVIEGRVIGTFVDTGGSIVIHQQLDEVALGELRQAVRGAHAILVPGARRQREAQALVDLGCRVQVPDRQDDVIESPASGHAVAPSIEFLYRTRRTTGSAVAGVRTTTERPCYLGQNSLPIYCGSR